MDFYDAWTKALKNTEIIRSRVSALQTYHETRVPYIFLAASSVNEGDTVVRKGDIVVEKPSLILPPNLPQLEGFEFDPKFGADVNSMFQFLLVRGVSLPSFKYNNTTHTLDIFEGNIDEAIKNFHKELLETENVTTGLLVGPEDVWQFSILIFICSQIARNTEMDLRRLMDDFKKRLS